MRSKLLILLLIFQIPGLFSQTAKENDTININVEPFYSSNPNTINVGSMSESLLNSERTTIKDIELEIKRSVESQRVEAIYVLSIKLFEFGFVKEAREWKYRAGTRYGVLKKTLKKTKIRDHGSEEFKQLHQLKELSRAVQKLLWGDTELITKEKYEFHVYNTKRKSRILNHIKPMNDNYPELQFEEGNAHSDAIEELQKGVKSFQKILQLINESRGYDDSGPVNE